MVSRKVLRAGTRIDLPDLTSRLFFALAEASPEPLSSERLALEVWDGSFVSDETIAQRVKLLRQALGDSARTPRYIKTVRGRGYRLVPGKPVESRPVRHMAAVLVAAALIGAAAIWNMSKGGEPNRTGNVVPADEASIGRVLAQAERYLATRRADDVDAAINLFRTALERWPSENASRIGLSFALSTRATKISGDEADALEAEVFARHAVEAERHNDEAWHALAYALDAQGRVDDAITAYMRAHELAPEKPSAASSAAYLLAIRGRFYDALKLEVTVLGGRDQSRYADTQVAEVLDLLGYTDAAARWRAKALMLSPGDAVVTGGAIVSELRHGDSARATALFAALPTDARETKRLRQISGLIHLANGDLTAASAAFVDADPLLYAATVAALGSEAPLIDLSVPDNVTWPGQYVDEAAYLAASGQLAAALKSLDRAVDLGFRDFRQLEAMPFFSSLKNDPAFEAIIARMKEDIAFQRKLLQSDDTLMLALGLKAEGS